MMKILLAGLLLTFGGSIAFACPNYPDLEILSPDTTTGVHHLYTHDIWAVWYHPDAYSRARAKRLAHRLAQVRCETIDALGMRDPQSAQDGYYTNVIVHVTRDDSVNDGFPNDWENAVSINDAYYAQVTLTQEASENMFVVDHEGFHIMQARVSNRFEDVEAYSYWIAEASAEWYAWNKQPDVDHAFELSGAIVASPQLPFWTERQKLPLFMVDNEVISDRPYAFNAFLAYAQTQTSMTKQEIVGGYYRGNQTPQELMADRLGFEGFADMYADFNAKLTAMLIEGNAGATLLDSFVMTDAQRADALHTLDYFLDAPEGADFQAIIQPIALHVDVSDLSDLEEQWIKPRAPARPYGWGYNVVKLENPTGTTPRLAFQGRHMRLRLVTLQDQQWHIRLVRDDGILNLKRADSAYLVVTSTPPRLGGFRRQGYKLMLR